MRRWAHFFNTFPSSCKTLCWHRVSQCTRCTRGPLHVPDTDLGQRRRFCAGQQGAARRGGRGKPFKSHFTPSRWFSRSSCTFAVGPGGHAGMLPTLYSLLRQMHRRHALTAMLVQPNPPCTAVASNQLSRQLTAAPPTQRSRCETVPISCACTKLTLIRLHSSLRAILHVFLETRCKLADVACVVVLEIAHRTRRACAEQPHILSRACSHDMCQVCNMCCSVPLDLHFRTPTRDQQAHDRR